MPRISGIDLSLEKRIDIALTQIFGIGRQNVVFLLKKANVDPAKRTKDLTEEEVKRIQTAAENYKTEGDLRAEVFSNIKRLKEIGSYRGSRHQKNLPSRGQRTRSNARTKRGKRVTIGAIKKKLAERMGLIAKEAPGDKKEDKK